MLTVPIIRELEPGRIFTVEKLPTIAQVRAASAEDARAGYWRGNYHVTRYHGTKANNYKSEKWIVDRFVDDTVNEEGEVTRGILSCRDVVQEITGRAADYTFSSMARQVVKWLCINQRRTETAQMLIPEWHFQYCRPFQSAHCTLYDMTAAYWQMAARAKSPIFDIVDGRILWRSLTSEQETRWNLIVHQLQPYKLLRLAIIGACAAGWNRGRDTWHGADSWRNGDVMKQAGEFPSPLQPLALLSVRSTAEVTQIQSDLSESLYTNADCVTTEQSRGPEYWDYCGLAWKVKACGPGEVRALGAWKIGARKPTDTYAIYAQQNRWEPHLDPYRIDRTIFHGQILDISTK